MLAAVNRRRHQPMGAVLAGGRGRRLGGDKAVVMLAGRPLIAYPLAALRAVVPDVMIVAKPDTALPAGDELGAVRVLREPAEPRHPLVGILHALRVAAGRPVLVCAADLPFLTAEVLRELVQTDPGDAPAVVATGADGAMQPLLGCYRPEAGPLLEAAAREAAAPVRSAVAAIGAQRLEVSADVLFNVNSREDLARAEELLAGLYPNVKS
jgi:molybdopterin-guanine dinucleotide biosynthesis protein A